jgi:hypothetical protein
MLYLLIIFYVKVKDLQSVQIKKHHCTEYKMHRKLHKQERTLSMYVLKNFKLDMTVRIRSKLRKRNRLSERKEKN